MNSPLSLLWGVEVDTGVLLSVGPEGVFSGSSMTSGLNPGGRNAETSSNFKESNNDDFDSESDLSGDVLLVESLGFWNNLGGLGLDLFLLKSG